MTTLEDLAAKWEREAAETKPGFQMDLNWASGEVRRCARELRAVSTWRPARGGNPPEEHKRVLIADHRGRIMIGYFMDGGWFDVGGDQWPRITHWQPLPTPPKV